MNIVIFIRPVLALLVWGGIITLQLTLMGIARFFERSSGQKTRYQLYILTITLTTIGAGRYIFRFQQPSTWPDFIGDPIANILLFFAGLMLLGLGNLLHERMMGGSDK